MKLYRYILLLAVFAVCLNSCKKSSKPVTPTPTAKKKYLVRVIALDTGYIGTNVPVTLSNIYYTYDSQKRLSTEKGFDKSLTTYAYKDNGDLYSASLTNPDGTMGGYTEYTYDGGKLQSYKYTSYYNNAINKETTYTYVYDGNRVSEIHFDIYYVKFTYDSNGNITREFNYLGSDNFTSVFTYDDKKNRFINSPLKYPTLTEIIRPCPNNQVTVTTEGLQNNILTTTKYTYDSDGYPTAGLTSSDAANTGSQKFTYIYSTLDD